METYRVTQDVKLFGVRVKNFPEGIVESFDALADKLPSKTGRTFYGVIQPDGDGMSYSAAVAEAYAGEAEKYGYETYVLPHGDYLTETIHDWKKKVPTIFTTFERLLTDKRLEYRTPTFEWYKNDSDLTCMVKLDPNKK